MRAANPFIRLKSVEDSTRLLYVASTRALHELHVLGMGKWCGQMERAMVLSSTDKGNG